MNDPNRRIDIDKSSLMSLKAELLRKQEEVHRAKSTTIMPEYVAKREKEPKSQENKVKQPKSSHEELEDSSQMARSKRILEAKAKYYEKMMKSGGSLNSDESSLVMFNQKHQDSRRFSSDSSEDSLDESAYPEEDWVEYTDCLGRTRKCLKKDLHNFQKRDEELSKVVEARNREQSEIAGHSSSRAKTPEVEMTEEEKRVEKILQIPDDVGERFREQREQWDEQQDKNLQKDFVHYQDVLFDEAREHGVGYYGFSVDEDERRKQQKELQNLHKQTIDAQKQKEELRNRRDQIIADRVKAAKARQRARMGLPPEEEEPEKEEKPDLDELNKKLLEEEQAKKREKEEKKREKERKKHVRPWDMDKSQNKGEEWSPRVEKEPLSQDQWNEKQREDRNFEFAPPQVFEKPNKFPIHRPPEEPFFEDRKGLFFSSKKSAQGGFKRKNYEPAAGSSSSDFTPTAIRNELSDEEEPVRKSRKPQHQGAAIPPPPSWDYFTPEDKRRRQPESMSKDQLEQSIEAGLRFLREQSDKGLPTTKNKWASNADY